MYKLIKGIGQGIGLILFGILLAISVNAILGLISGICGVGLLFLSFGEEKKAAPQQDSGQSSGQEGGN